MIKKIDSITGLGKFTEFNQQLAFTHGQNNCNIIFGSNGSGKTTISNILSFYGNNQFISENEKKELFEDIKCTNDANTNINIGNSSIKYPANNTQNKDIFVFNSNFVVNHIYNGVISNMKKFTSTGIELKNKEIDQINSEIDKLNKEKEKCIHTIEQVDNQLESVFKVLNADFSNSLTDKNKRLTKPQLIKYESPTSSLDEIKETIQKLKFDYEVSKKQEELDTALLKLKGIVFNDLDTDITGVSSLLAKNIQQLSKDALESKIREVQNLFSDDDHKNSVERWYKFGFSILQSSDSVICPLCNSDISKQLDDILKDYSGYFDETYNTFITDLSDFKTKISELISDLMIYENNCKTLNEIRQPYSEYLKDLPFIEYDFKEIKDAFKTIFKCVSKKIENVQIIKSFPNGFSETINGFTTAMTTNKKFHSQSVEILESKTLNTNKIEEKIRNEYKLLIIKELDVLSKGNIVDKYKNALKRKVEIEQDANSGIPFWQNKLNEEIRKLKIESKSISTYLHRLGVDNFDIDLNDDSPNENIVIQYNHSQKNKLRNTLSDGEKTALAFAYFLSKFEHEVNLNMRKSATVIIDDPISSLDEGRLYSTASLINHFFKDVNQIIVLSHNFLFLKHFYSLYKKKATCLYLCNNTLSPLPEELNNFETPYYYMLKSIIDYSNAGNKNEVYYQAKRYLPNYIRRALETFLSFKFSSLVDTGEKSPGLNNFNKKILSTSYDEDTKSELNLKIQEIVRITDAHSHGNLHHLQEGYYISESDLNRIVEYALSIIERMDNLHLSSYLVKQNIELTNK